jgi:hypothetical protein
MGTLIRALKQIRSDWREGHITDQVFERCRYDIICASVVFEIDRVRRKRHAQEQRRLAAHA